MATATTVEGKQAGREVIPETPLWEVEDALKQLKMHIAFWTGEFLVEDNEDHRRFHHLCEVVTRRTRHLTATQSICRFIERYLKDGSERDASRKQDADLFGDALEEGIKWLEALRSGQSGVSFSNEVYIAELRELQRTCHCIVTGEEDGRQSYEDRRARLLSANPFYLPLTVAACSQPGEYLQAAFNVSLSRGIQTDFVDYEFNELIDLISQAAEPTTSVPASGWTGRPTVKEQVRTIQALAPVVLCSLDELIELQERLLHNQVIEPAQAQAVSLLRELHAAIGHLLAAVDRGRPFKALQNKVRRLGERLFAMSRETKELLVLGAPTMAATGLTLGIVKGLELISGFNLGEIETAAIITVAGGSFAMHDVAKRGRAKQS